MTTKPETNNLESLKADFFKLLDPEHGTSRITKLLAQSEKNGSYLQKWYAFSKKAQDVYPSQGLLQTPHDYLDYQMSQILPQDILIETLRIRRYFLEIFNHPYRLNFLNKVSQSKFIAPPKIICQPIETAINNGLSLAIGDLGATPAGSQNPRISRRERYAQGPFIKLGKQARALFIGSSSPDIWNSSAAIATMAASHCLAAIPRNGLLSDIKRQSDVAKEVFQWLDETQHELLADRNDRKDIAKYWKNNVMGTLEASEEEALKRADSLIKTGVSVFRIYSPEPGTGTIDTVKKLRKYFGHKIEVFTSFIVDVNQAKKAQEAGADGIFVGIGGGGRCTTGVRSGSAIDWPELVHKLRGEIEIPIIVEGGATDHVAVSLLLGASGISVSRAVAGGTIESPGGAMFLSDAKGRLFKPYGGEASARAKFIEKKLLAFNIPSFIEGETGNAYLNFSKHLFPTLTLNLHTLTEDATLAMVFKGVANIHELHAINPSPLRQITTFGDFQRNSH
ncbi:hypothetical protein A2899_02425 [Candidatus Amesbacteria bacterium RIFCSPLOWO2_01_FULL_49_25]|uniref:IMP dehydrogenase/GMP reductase domain-containing protein n=1 Tax=Candidatus Amesbacteria bacterium RIFCSPHIGHO2_01_FULL_48_32b TaxID=1797253 RepID=A0A1F4YEQ7_9BACT|nr:MAG: hypothetical protein A2876_04155 [Candidatus Amesbacteria bacterium RIFCSPHIGHO2_01_FULL_48_32b]OGD08592.1 MAG: hypothetical protein A2899_02425 [Candidatus Amesbacteria bacterium RIFCSPLOWO2_01_FULL_49_25]